MPNSIARRALVSFSGNLISVSIVVAGMLVALPAAAQQGGIVSASGAVIYGPPEQITVTFSASDALAGILRRQGVSDAEAAAVENGVRKTLSPRQSKEGAILLLQFAGLYGARSLDRVSVEPVSGSNTVLTRKALGLPPATPVATAAAPAENKSEEVTPPQTAAAAQPTAEPTPQPAEKPAAADPVLQTAAPATPSAKPVSTGGAAPAVTAQPPSMVGHHAFSSGYARATGVATGELVSALQQAGVPRSVADEVQRAVKHHPTLNSASLANSRFEIVYDPSFDASAGFSLAAFNVNGRDHRIWRFQPQAAPGGLFADDGERLAGIVLQSPMPGVEINSGFGMRKHPVLRVAKMHWGVDFPADNGTPILAAADGVITAAKRYGNYGLYMHIDHGQGVATTYGHMQRFAPGMKPGVKVKAGDVIAHVGRSGLATGPHLYFEVLIGERRVDPEPLIAEGGSRLVGSDMAAFERVKLQSGVTEIASESRN